jgi:phosphoribosyl 1,2-cyclic phosphodiesterase
MGRPDANVARRLAGAHLLVLEFNHDPGLVEAGPYPPALKRRILGNAGHLSNEQAGEMLRALAGPQLHTLVLAHLSKTNNRPLLALSEARSVLAELGLERVQVEVADQDGVGPSLPV